MPLIENDLGGAHVMDPTLHASRMLGTIRAMRGLYMSQTEH